MYRVKKGSPNLGSNLTLEGIQLGIYAPNAHKMLLKFYENQDDLNSVAVLTLDKEAFTTGDIFHIEIIGLNNATLYTWQIIDEKENISHCLLDPYATGVIQKKEGQNIYFNMIPRRLDDLVASPKIEWEDTVIYELHVGHYTKNDLSQEESKRGTFNGLINKLPYLKKLGITTIELLPILKWNRHTLKNKCPKTGELLYDEWGYNTIGFFAIDPMYCENPLNAREEFLNFMNKAHELGMEVILDVVYNHSGEGMTDALPINFKALADEVYYKKQNDRYLNCSGTGNVLNAKHVVVKNMILDSLNYWVTTFGVDGFRFDLAIILNQDEHGNCMEHGILDDIANHPVLRHVKLISESWDAKGSYKVGHMPAPFREWSDSYRDSIKRVVKGDYNMMPSFAKCIIGEDIGFKDWNKNAFSSIHFITAHDGFTLWDLVSYNNKHNDENGEGNRDGHNCNHSDNCGFEGETDNPDIIAMRIKRIKNYMAILLLSSGVPMVQMGDELGRTQNGNNNAFCQNNEMVWVDWDVRERKKELNTFMENMIAFRKQHISAIKKGKDVVKWHGVSLKTPDWTYYSRSLAWEVSSEGQRYYVAINNFTETLKFEMPSTTKKWSKIIDTDKKESFLKKDYTVSDVEPVAEYSICVFKEN
ncbi:MAG: alpha-amylase family glycosyl hydrolase [Cellulosilyticaceae bacterium]